MKKKKYISGRNKKGWYKKPITDYEDLDKLFRIPGKEGLMIKFGLYWGLRVSEIVGLKWDDIMERPGYVIHRLDFIVAKQSNIRQTSAKRGLGMNPDLKAHIEAYYEEEGRPPMERYLFYPSQQRQLDKHVTAKTARLWIKRAARRAKCRHADIDFHQLRRSMFLRYYEKNGLAMTLAMTGHTSPQTLLTYLGITQESVIEGFDGLWGEETLSLFDMYEKGMIDVNVKLITNTKPVSKWQDEVTSRLMAYSSDLDECHRLARALLLPHRLERVRNVNA